ncbi:acyltransferase family protein [Streptomyces sp. 769]|uniref:acyltransferase family protein n=1 Tax=Streptomyces sp. 769 TaxID=1262452 RepID=UPI000581BEE2|nr:acyltransferase family protein [Streptomyces sp. 769]AJC54828.1 peptidoglycan-N-acetylmuramate O-acetyltransferase [Streptomyces sp. 769]
MSHTMATHHSTPIDQTARLIPPRPDAPPPRRPYAPGLDGLRALAVTAVVLYHVNPAWLPGGFLGVDVFFVLSGYLITDLLLAEHRRGGRIDLRGFWARRARRLLPALALVLLTTTCAATVLRPDRLTTAAGDLLSAATFTNNWWQTATDASYFAHFGPPPLFQHLWTLSLEEQFYLLWPLALLALLRVVRRNGARAALAGAGALASATAMTLLYEPGTDASRVYFGTDSHLFPLLIGSALALLRPAAGLLPGQLPCSVRTADIAGLAGLSALAILSWTASQDADALYAGGFVLAACAAALAVLAAVQPTGLLARALAAPWLRWLGKRSYGIYLWHLPALALATPDERTPGDVPLNALAAATASIALAALTHRFVEEPIRRQGFRSTARRMHRALTTGTATRHAGAVLWARTAAGIAVTAVLVAGCGVVTAPMDGNSAADQIQAGQRALENSPQTAAHTEKITAIGDSVMVAATPALKQKFPGIDIDAKVGRQLSLAAKEINTHKQQGPLGDAVVIGLGTNGVGGAEDLQSAVDAIGPDKPIVLITVHAPRQGWQDKLNKAVKDVAAKNSSHVAVADWDKAIAGHTDLLANDGIHPGPGGGKIYADTVAHALATLDGSR